MARILIGWELGSNRGHVTRVMPIARRLASEGHEVSVALQSPSFAEAELPRGASLWQAPLWSGLLHSHARQWSAPVATMGDILARLGLDQPGMLAGLVRGWDSILAATDADIVIADFAPALLTAAHGRATTIITGNGFTCPPGHLDCFPSLTGEKPAFLEADLLDIADADLAECGRNALPYLPALFASDHAAITTFQGLDPYATERLPGHYCLPTLPPGLRDLPNARGEEIFVYGYNKIGPELPLWEAVARTGKPVRIFVPEAGSALLAHFSALGFLIEHQPVPFHEIARRSRIVVSHGGHGFASAALLAGLPHFVAWFDLEKTLTARAITTLGTGECGQLITMGIQTTAEQLKQMCDNQDMHRRATSVAAGLALSDAPTAEDKISEIAARV